MQKLLLVITVLMLAAAASGGPAPVGKPAPGLYIGQVLDSLRSGRYNFHTISSVDTTEYYREFSWGAFRPVGRVGACPDSSCVQVERGTNGAYYLGNLPGKFAKLEAFVFPYEGFSVFQFSTFGGGVTVDNYFVFDHQQRTYYNFHYGSTFLDSVELQARWPLRNIMELDSNLRVRQRIGLDSGEVWFRSSFSYRGRTVRENVAFISRVRGTVPSFRTDQASIGELFSQPPPPGHRPLLLTLDLPPFFMWYKVPIWACDLNLFYDFEAFFNGYSRDNKIELDWP